MLLLTVILKDGSEPKFQLEDQEQFKLTNDTVSVSLDDKLVALLRENVLGWSIQEIKAPAEEPEEESKETAEQE